MPAVFDFRNGDEVVMLGFNVSSKDGGFKIQVAGKSLERFKDKLMELDGCPDAAGTAYLMLSGWFNEQGPAYSPKYARKIVRDIVACLKKLKLAHIEVKLEGVWPFRLGNQSEWLTLWKTAHHRWQDRIRHGR